MSKDDWRIVYDSWSFRKADGFFRKAIIAMFRPIFRIQRDHNEAMIRLIAQMQQRINMLEQQLRPKLYVNPDSKNITFSRQDNSFNYYEFERLFHGTEAEIKQRQVRYVEFLRGRVAILDVGCGRGELLELLKAEGFPARGIDLDPLNIKSCRAKGLDVIEGDFQEGLALLPDNSLDAIISIQFIEHLPLETLAAFFRLACNKLKENGIFIAETVNPYHLAQFRFFHVDPTHQKPIYPEVAQFFCRSAGFHDVSVVYVPCIGSPETGLQEPWDYCDYAVIANKTPFDSTKQFRVGDKCYDYLSHPYNTTWANERAVEVPVVWEIVNSYRGRLVLEVGNVLSHYFTVSHDVLDKYEQAERVINLDVADYRTDKRYELIVAISTVEHIGWDEEPKDTEKVLKAIANMKALLAPDGKLVLTVPLGYNPNLDAYLRAGRIEFAERHCLKRIAATNNWIEVAWEAVQDARYNAPYPFANGVIILTIAA